jgi:RNA polymerase sigma-70 factor (ECF subfamily)
MMDKAETTTHAQGRAAILDGLVLRVLQGDLEAFDEIVADTKPYVAAIARRYLSNGEDVEDACQEAYLRVFAAIASYQAKGKFLPWVRRIAANACLAALRKRDPLKAVAMYRLDNATSPDSHQAETIVLQRQWREMIQKCLPSLGKQERLAVELCYQQDLPPNEAAAKMGIKPGTLRDYLASARGKMKKQLDRVLLNGHP